VIDEAGRFIGVARQERTQASVDGGEGWLTVGSVLDLTEAAGWCIAQDRPIAELVGSESLRRQGALMAVDGDGILRGVITVEQVSRALQAALRSFGPPTGARR